MVINMEMEMAPACVTLLICVVNAHPIMLLKFIILVNIIYSLPFEIVISFSMQSEYTNNIL